MIKGQTGLSQNLKSDTSSFVILGLLLYLSVPQFIHLWNEVNISTYLLELLWGLNEITNRDDIIIFIPSPSGSK